MGRKVGAWRQALRRFCDVCSSSHLETNEYSFYYIPRFMSMRLTTQNVPISIELSITKSFNTVHVPFGLQCARQFVR